MSGFPDGLKIQGKHKNWTSKQIKGRHWAQNDPNLCDHVQIVDKATANPTTSGKQDHLNDRTIKNGYSECDPQDGIGAVVKLCAHVVSDNTLGCQCNGMSGMNVKLKVRVTMP
jgi:hypothetical protein